jgi:DNA-binding response OmpR family regulator
LPTVHTLATVRSAVVPSKVSIPGRGSPGARERERRSRVLIAEDDDSLRVLMRLSVDVGGLYVDEAADGPTALELARSNAPDVALLDWMLPGLSGLEVCRALRADPSTAGALIVIVTARTLPEDRDEALAAGADHYVAKPFSPDALLETVRHAL